MPEHILVANRGEIAIRVLRTAADLEIESTAVHALDDSLSLHTRHADHVIDLKEEGVAAYLNVDKHNFSKATNTNARLMCADSNNLMDVKRYNCTGPWTDAAAAERGTRPLAPGSGH